MDKRTLHVKLSEEEFTTLQKWKGDKKWKPWLLSIPEQLRKAADRAEKAELKHELALRDVKDLAERCTQLQSHIEKMEADNG